MNLPRLSTRLHIDRALGGPQALPVSTVLKGIDTMRSGLYGYWRLSGYLRALGHLVDCCNPERHRP